MFGTMSYIICLLKSQNLRTNNLQLLKGEQQEEVTRKAKQPGIVRERQKSRKTSEISW
jgi:hypothetical protein